MTGSARSASRLTRSTAQPKCKIIQVTPNIQMAKVNAAAIRLLWAALALVMVFVLGCRTRHVAGWPTSISLV